MKLMASGVMHSAAMVRSPSFSRSSSSTTTSIRPARNSSIASGMVANGFTSYRITSRCKLTRMARLQSQALVEFGGDRNDALGVAHQVADAVSAEVVIERVHGFERQRIR